MRFHFIFIFFFVLCQQLIAQPVIKHLNIHVNDNDKNIYGSVLGGTRLYLVGTGFTFDKTQFTMIIGPYLCPINYMTTVRLSCITEPVDKPGTYPIELYFLGERVPCEAPVPCEFSFKWGIKRSHLLLKIFFPRANSSAMESFPKCNNPW